MKVTQKSKHCITSSLSCIARGWLPGLHYYPPNWKSETLSKFYGFSRFSYIFKTHYSHLIYHLLTLLNGMHQLLYSHRLTALWRSSVRLSIKLYDAGSIYGTFCDCEQSLWKENGFFFLLIMNYTYRNSFQS